MSIDFKKQFQDAQPPDSKFRSTVRDREFHTAIALSLASLSYSGASQDELKGARRFIDTLLDLGEPTQAPGRLPERRLDPSVMSPSEEQLKSQAEKAKKK